MRYQIGDRVRTDDGFEGEVLAARFAHGTWWLEIHDENGRWVQVSQLDVTA